MRKNAIDTKLGPKIPFRMRKYISDNSWYFLSTRNQERYSIPWKLTQSQSQTIDLNQDENNIAVTDKVKMLGNR